MAKSITHPKRFAKPSSGAAGESNTRDPSIIINELTARVALRQQYHEPVHSLDDVKKALASSGYSLYQDELMRKLIKLSVGHPATGQFYVRDTIILKAANDLKIPFQRGELEAALKYHF